MVISPETALTRQTSIASCHLSPLTQQMIMGSTICHLAKAPTELTQSHFAEVVNLGDCIGCINNATAELRNLCPNQKEAIIWYDNCMFRYANRSIFGVMETDRLFYMWNPNNVTNVDALIRPWVLCWIA